MAVKHLKPTSAGRRFQTISDFAEITTDKPEKSLLEPLPHKAGRNNNGRITTRHQGGGNKRKYRKIDFKRRKDDVPAKVATIEYDPNRSARIALLHYVDGAKAYILAPQGLKVGDTVISGTKDVDIKPGNCMPLSEIPVGTLVHAVEFQPGKGAAMATTATQSCVCPPPSSVECFSPAAPPLVSWATPTTPTSSSARLAATAGPASVPPSVVRS